MYQSKNATIMEIPQKPLLNYDEVLALLPHADPMVMIDKLWSSKGDNTVSGFLVKESNIFCKNKVLQEPALIENVAQTAAIRVGYQALLAAQANNEQPKPPFGYIVAVKNCRIHELPKVNDELKTSISVKALVMNVYFIEGTVFKEGKAILECEMRIYQEDHVKSQKSSVKNQQ